MNRLDIIGNLTKDPEIRTLADGKKVCNMTVAVNDRHNKGAEFFRVAAWNALGESCAKYLAKGRKVAVSGSVSLREYTGQDGKMRASLEVNAHDVEFLSPNPNGNGDKLEPVQTQDNPFEEVPY